MTFVQRVALRVCVAAGLLVAAAVLAYSFVWTQAGLERWCQSASREYLLSRNETPGGWVPFMSSALGDEPLAVYGSWKVGAKVYTVRCSAPFFSRSSDAKFHVAEQ